MIELFSQLFRWRFAGEARCSTRLTDSGAPEFMPPNTFRSRVPLCGTNCSLISATDWDPLYNRYR
jgi:hypothetical protein